MPGRRAGPATPVGEKGQNEWVLNGHWWHRTSSLATIERAGGVIGGEAWRGTSPARAFLPGAAVGRCAPEHLPVVTPLATVRFVPSAMESSSDVPAQYAVS